LKLNFQAIFFKLLTSSMNSKTKWKATCLMTKWIKVGKPI
jgi:hypothetical protein